MKLDTESLSKKRVVLFNPEPKGFKGAEIQIPVPPFALLAIAGPLWEAGYDIKIIDAVVEENWQGKITKYADGAICFGVTSMTGYQIKGGVEMSKLVKERYPDVRVIWGGYHPSIMPEQTAANKYIDIVVRGQGERTMLEVVQHLKKHLSLDGILGITYKNDGKIVINPDRFFEDINNFPSFQFHLIDVERYIIDSLRSQTIGYMSSQGCPYQCKFCAELKVTKRRWSGLKAERVLNDIEYLVKNHGINGLHIYDSNFFINKKRVEEICEGLLARNIDIAWGNVNLRADQITYADEKLLKLLKQTHCEWFLTGAESGRQEILDFITKGTKVEDTIRLKEIFSRYDFKPLFGFVLGFPYKNLINVSLKEDFDAIIDTVRRIQTIDRKNEFLLWLYTPYPGTPIYNLAIQNGVREPKNLEEWSRFTLNFSNIPWLPKKYEKIADQLNYYIFPYTSSHFNTIWEIKYQGHFKALKRVFHRVLQVMARFRLKYRFLCFPIEYEILSFRRRWKARKINAEYQS